MTKVSIVIVTYERLAATQRLIESLVRFTDYPYKLLLVDNASSEKMREFLLKLDGKKLLLDRNYGLYKALNLGVTLTKTELVAFLDCDIVLRPAWLTALVNTIQMDRRIGLVGSRYLNPDGSLQEGYPILRPDGWYGSNKIDHSGIADCQYIAIGCSLFRTKAWENVGGFDESYFISHGDIDFCYKLRYQGGYRVIYCPNSSVVHDHTFGAEESYEKIRFDPLRISQDFNRFKAKWANYYSREKPIIPVEKGEI
jgi:GT2 family glycosyltransferase